MVKMVLWTCWLVVPYYLSENSNLLSVFKQTFSIALMCKRHTVVPGEWPLPIVVALSSNNLSETHSCCAGRITACCCT